MIIDFILDIFKTVYTTVLGVLPNLPQTPQAVIDGGQWAIDQITAVGSLLEMIVSTPLLVATMVVVAGIYLFEFVYHSVMWVLKKIPMLAIK